MFLRIIVLVLFLITWIKVINIMFKDFDRQLYCLCDQKKRSYLWKDYHKYYKTSSIMIRLTLWSVVSYLIGLQYVNMLIVKNEYYNSYVFELTFYTIVFFIPYVIKLLLNNTYEVYMMLNNIKNTQNDDEQNSDKRMHEFIKNMRAEPRYYEKHWQNN